MSTINILPSHIVDKIAAGEVVARPASVVKELIDNSIDAKASSITVDISAGGKKSIAVIDDGQGMDLNDAKCAFKRHATSKIKSEDDLGRITTLGFRGEALAAISAVSRLKMETKVCNPQILEGTRVLVEAGELKEVSAVGCPGGTSMFISDLFFNVPARLKFLRSDPVEYGHIAEMVASLALAHSHIRFELCQEGVPKLRCHRTGGDLKRIEDVLGEETREELISFTEGGGEISLKGFVSKPGITKTTARNCYFFLNGRPIRDRALHHALLKGFGTYLGKGEYPTAILYVTIDPTLVDVNVHPTKNEVRFADTGVVHDFVMSAVRKVLASGGTVGHREEVQSRRGDPKEKIGLLHPSGLRNDKVEGEGSVAENILFEEPSRLRVIGQFNQAFIICEEGEELVLIDQHAAHERLGFEMLKAQLAKGKVEQQQLLLPEQLKLNSKEFSVIEENISLISQTGFEVEPFGGQTLLIKAIPAILGEVSLKPLFEKMAADLSEFSSSQEVEEAVSKVLSVIACHRQVRAGDTLTKEELHALVKDIERYNISCCPHGRPATVRIKRQELEKWFKRT